MTIKARRGTNAERSAITFEDGEVLWTSDTKRPYFGDGSTLGGIAIALTSDVATEVNDLTAAVTWTNVPDANITQTSVVQHEAALTITESQISDLGAYLTAEANDLSAAVVWANIPDANVPVTAVTQHQAALTVTESQISDLGSYLTDAPSDGSTYGRNNGAWVVASGGAGIWGSITGTLSNQTDLQAVLDNKQDIENGFEDRTDSTMTFTDGTRTFEISPTGVDYTIHAGGSTYVKSSAENIVIPDLEGIHFIYFDGSGVLQTTQTFSSAIILDFAFTALVYWDATNSTAITFAEERHGSSMNSATHLYNHETIGTRYGNGLLPVNIDADGNGNDASAAQIGVSSGTIWDEDIEISIPADAVPANIPILYRSGAAGDWRKIAATDYIATTTGTGRGAWNEDTGATWQLTEVANNDFFCMHLYATNDLNEGYFLIVGQTDYTTIGNARTGASSELFNLSVSGLPVVEYKAVATFIMQTSNSYGNAVQSRVRTTDLGDDYIDWRFIDSGIAVSVTGGGASALPDLTDVTITAAAKGDLLAHNGTEWVDVSVGTDGQVLVADSVEASGVKWDTIAGGSEVNDLTASVTWANVPDANITQTSVTQHEAALTITESQISDLSHTDSTAIHDNVSGEISLITEKTTPVNADLVIIEDSADSNNKKRVQVGNLPGGGGASTLSDLTDTSITTPSSGDSLVYQAGNYTDIVSMQFLNHRYKLDELAGTTATDSEGSLDGTYTNSPTLGSTGFTSETGTSVTFSRASSQYIDLPNNLLAGGINNFSVSAIIKPSSVPADATGAERRMFINNDTAPSLYIGHDGVNPIIRGTFFDSGSGFNTTNGTTTIVAGTTYHVAMVYNGTDLRIYVNGVLDNVPLAQTLNTQLQTSGDVYIGRISTAAQQYFDGDIDEVLTSTAAWTAAEVLAQSNARSGSSQWINTDAVEFTSPPVFPSYVVASVPSAASFTGGMIYVSDETGGATMAFSDGTDWRRVQDRAVVS